VQTGDAAYVFSDSFSKVTRIDEAMPVDLDEEALQASASTPTGTTEVVTAGDYVAYLTDSGAVFAGRLSGTSAQLDPFSSGDEDAPQYAADAIAVDERGIRARWGDWLSSTNQTDRQFAVDTVKKTIDAAAELGARGIVLRQPFDDVAEEARRHRQVEQDVGAGLAIQRRDPGRQAAVFLIVLEVRDLIEQSLTEPRPSVPVDLVLAELAVATGRQGLQEVPQALAKPRVVIGRAIDAQDFEAIVQQAGLGKVVQRRDQQTLGQVASGSEDHHHAIGGGIGFGQRPQAIPRREGHVLTTCSTCPPKRMAESRFSPEMSTSRERANRTVDNTPAGA